MPRKADRDVVVLALAEVRSVARKDARHEMGNKALRVGSFQAT